MTTIGIVAIGAALPATPLATMLGFTPLPPMYYLFLGLATVTYLLLVEVAKRRLFRKHPGRGLRPSRGTATDQAVTQRRGAVA